MLTVDKLRKTYHTGSQVQTVFDALTFQLSAGETVALLGASGSGKTTLLNLLAGIDAPDAGRVTIDGTDIHALGEPERTLFRRYHIGFVFQFFNLIPTLTVGENVALPMELVDREPDASRARTERLLDEVGLSGMADRYPETLSGGEQQRTAIARALSHQPRLLLADEPTGNLDGATGRVVLDLLVSLRKDEGATLVLVTHDPEVAAVADRRIHLLDGRIDREDHS
jgi:putative ABC transport system ATP-binding protein